MYFDILNFIIYFNTNNMSKLVSENEIDRFKKDGAVLLKNKFDIS